MRFLIIIANVLSLGLVADDSRPKPNKNRLIIKLKTNMDKNKTIPTLSQTTVTSSYSTNLCFENVEQMLIEKIADFLDEEEILIQESMAELKDPEPREKTELHIRMAKVAMQEYKSTMLGL